MKALCLSLDTLRFDRVSTLGGRRRLTPNLDRLFQDGVVFTQATSSDIPTQPSHTALFTGRYGINTGIVSHFHPPARLALDQDWLPTMMRDRGHATGAVDHLFAMKDWFVRGYDNYMPPPGRSRSPGSVVNELAFPWLNDHAREDFFLFLHYWDAHIPYVPPSPFKERFTAGSVDRHDPEAVERIMQRPSYPLFKRNLYDFLDIIPNLEYIEDLYDAEVAYLDFELGRLFDHLDGLGILDETLVVAFADHGENMTEHAAWFDHAGLYDSVVRVPLMMRLPSRLRAGRIDDPVQLVDVFPTVLEILGEAPPPRTDGRSLLPRIEGRPVEARPTMLSECTWQASRGVRTERWKYIRCYEPGIYDTPPVQLFDLGADPAEQFNIAGAHPDVVAQLDRQLQRWVAEQLDGRPDPMGSVIEDGLPAVRRLEDVIREDAAAAALA